MMNGEDTDRGEVRKESQNDVEFESLPGVEMGTKGNKTARKTGPIRVMRKLVPRIESIEKNIAKQNAHNKFARQEKKQINDSCRLCKIFQPDQNHRPNQLVSRSQILEERHCSHGKFNIFCNVE